MYVFILILCQMSTLYIFYFIDCPSVTESGTCTTQDGCWWDATGGGGAGACAGK